MIKSVVLFISIFLFYVHASKDNEFRGSYICFNINLIKVKVNYERVRWPGSDFNNVCSLSFSINSTKPAYFYYSRGLRDPDYCKEIINEWEKYKNENRKVCIAARLDPPEIERYMGVKILERSAPYEIIRIGKWCHSYFEGYCE